jgi:hypothetical protein
LPPNIFKVRLTGQVSSETGISFRIFDIDNEYF